MSASEHETLDGSVVARAHHPSERHTLDGDDERTQADADHQADAREPEQPARIGRHVVIDRLGEGGMGVVYAAYDPELDRKLAIKLIRARARDDARAHARMLREAQAMAKLAHPNVIAIYDVGTHAGQVYIAMEFVAGLSLDRWVAQLDADDPARWQQLLAVYVDAGRGLAAAHAAGLVHRDFKPANVLVGDDGRVRVLDFGLARTRREQTAADELTTAEFELEFDVTHDPARRSSSAFDAELTEVGALIGTPAYMPPERLEGERSDARGDQFSFCVALWESLYGARPFAGATLPELVSRLLEGRRSEPDPRRRASVPDWLHAALLRGTAREPEDRYADMPALLAALEPPIAPRRRGAGLAFAFAGLAFVCAGAWSLARDREAPLCSGFAARLDGVWDASREQALASAFSASRLPYAERSATELGAAIDTWTTAWTRARTDACEATHLRGEQSAELLDLRMACFDRRLRELDALLDVLEVGDEEVIEHAAATAAALPSLSQCDDPERLRGPAREPDDPALRARTAELDEAQNRLAALQAAGRGSAALREAEALAPEIAATGWPPLIGRHALLLGRAAEREEQIDPALAALVEAVAVAHELGDPELSAAALTEMVWALRRDPARAAEIDRWIRLAEAASRRLGDVHVEAELRLAIGRARWQQGRYDQARQEFERSLALRVAEFGPDSFAAAEARDAIAETLWRSGEIEQARALFLEVRDAHLAALGPDHPRLARMSLNLGAVTWLLGDYDGAAGHYRDALALLERVHGPEHWRLGEPLGNLGACYAMQGRFDEARPYFERNVAIEREHTPEGSSALALGLDNLAELERLAGDRSRARALIEEGYAMRVRLLGSDHPDTARSLISLGGLELEDGRAEAARDHFERAIALREGLAVHRDLLGEARLGLAEALAALGQRERIPALVTAARADYAASGTKHAERDADIEATIARLLADEP